MSIRPTGGIVNTCGSTDIVQYRYGDGSERPASGNQPHRSRTDYRFELSERTRSPWPVSFGHWSQNVLVGLLHDYSNHQVIDPGRLAELIDTVSKRPVNSANTKPPPSSSGAL
jgi:hypothetical protein